MNKVAALIAIVVVLGGGYWLLHRSPSYSTDTTNNYTEVTPSPVEPTPTPTTTTSTPTATAVVKEFTVKGGNFYFSPSTITVNKGDTVKITFVNAGGTHDLKIDGFNVATPRLDSGQTATLTFVADKAGTFEYYCTVGTHRQMGMKGTLTVK